MVAGGPKNTHRELRSISKKSAKNFSFFLFFSKSRGIFNNVLTAKNGLWGGLKTPKMAIEAKKAIFSKSVISQVFTEKPPPLQADFLKLKGGSFHGFSIFQNKIHDKL